MSPDKGIGYCFACNSGGDIFSFYQKIEGVDFVQALKDLAERAGVQLPDREITAGPKKEEKERLRDCLAAASAFYRTAYATSDLAKSYIKKRGVPDAQVAEFGIGYAPDSFSQTYEHLLKQGFSRTDIVASGLGVQKDLGDSRIYDRFRNRLIFPILDGQGEIVGFGGRTLGDDDAKYINSSEGILYKKSQVLFGFDKAKDAIRDSRAAILVEGYFDVLACHRIGVKNVVATSGTALTEEHARILKRFCDTVHLCLDSDQAGQDAAERAFFILSKEKVAVQSIALPSKDPGDAVNDDPDGLKVALTTGSIPFIERVLLHMKVQDLSSALAKRDALLRVLPILQALPLAVERDSAIAKAAAIFQTSETALRDDLLSVRTPTFGTAPVMAVKNGVVPFSAQEIVLGMFLMNLEVRSLLSMLIEPEDAFANAVYKAIQALPPTGHVSIEDLPLADEHRERASILQLWGEEHGFAEWSETLAIREIKKNCISANREVIKKKQQEITQKLLAARSQGNATEEALLQIQYQEIIKLSKMAV